MEIKQILDIINRDSSWTLIRSVYLPDGVYCPTCGSEITGTLALESFRKMKRTYCGNHKSSFHPMATIPVLRGTEWEPEEFVKFLLLNQLKQSVAEISEILGKSPACVREMLIKVDMYHNNCPVGFPYSNKG